MPKTPNCMKRTKYDSEDCRRFYLRRMLGSLVLGFSLSATSAHCEENSHDEAAVGTLVGAFEQQDEAPKAAVIAEKKSAVGKSTDAVGQTLKDSAAEKQAVFGSLLTESGLRWWTNRQARLDDKTGLRLSVDYNALIQAASDSLADDYGSAGEFRATARWRVWGRENGNLGFIDFQIRNRHRYTDMPPSKLGGSIGSLWPTTRGFSDSGWEVTHAYFEQYLFNQRLAFRGGQTRIDNMFDVHALRSQRHFFLNSAFSDNPAVAFPSFGPAGAVLLRPIDAVEIMVGVADADSRQLGEAVGSDLQRDNLFAAVELSVRPKLLEQGDSLLKAMYWHTDPSSGGQTPAGDGVSLLAQHQLLNRSTGFLRYSYSSSAATIVSHMISTGIGLHPWIEKRSDYAGVAFAWGRPTRTGLRDQYVLEAFYRLQITPELELTPDIQLIIHPSLNSQQDVIGVFGARARLNF